MITAGRFPSYVSFVAMKGGGFLLRGSVCHVFLMYLASEIDVLVIHVLLCNLSEESLKEYSEE